MAPSLACVAAFVLVAVTPAFAQDAQVFGDLRVETAARGLVHPWALAFLPDGRMLVTERPSRMRIVARNGELSPPITGLPRMAVVSQGGLLDVAIDREYARNRTVFFCYSRAVTGGMRTTFARARLHDDSRLALENTTVILPAAGPPSEGFQLGCRIAQSVDGNLFLAVGDHAAWGPFPQALDNHLGKVLRIRPDGTVPDNNPFVGRQNVKAEIWSYGHRNPQGLAIDPASGKLWEHEHGPTGGDELNLVVAGNNYGAPLIHYGPDQPGCCGASNNAEKPGMEPPVRHWTPSIAPSGMAFYSGDLFPAWRGNLFIGALAAKLLVRIELQGEKVVKEERLLQGLGERIRDVRQGPDGALWLLTDDADGRILRVVPAR
jgi:aldose sugar dehydrogenase